MLNININNNSLKNFYFYTINVFNLILLALILIGS